MSSAATGPGAWWAWHPSMRLVALALTEVILPRAASLSTSSTSSTSSLHRWARHRLFDRQLVRLINQHVQTPVKLHCRPPNGGQVAFSPATDEVVMVKRSNMLEVYNLSTCKSARHIDFTMVPLEVKGLCVRPDAPVAYLTTQFGIWECHWETSSCNNIPVSKLWKEGDHTNTYIKCHPTKPELFMSMLMKPHIQVVSYAGDPLCQFEPAQCVLPFGGRNVRSLAVDALTGQVFVLFQEHSGTVVRFSPEGTHPTCFMRFSELGNCIAIDSKRRVLCVAAYDYDGAAQDIVLRYHLTTGKQLSSIFLKLLNWDWQMNIDVHESTGQVLVCAKSVVTLHPPSLF